MALKATMWMVPDNADVNRCYSTAGVAAGDLIFELDTNQMWIVHTTGLQSVAGGTSTVPSATPTKSGSVKQIPSQAAITDNTGGAASTTFAAIAAGASYTQADMVAVKNALAQIVVSLNALRTAMKNAGQSA